MTPTRTNGRYRPEPLAEMAALLRREGSGVDVAALEYRLYEIAEGIHGPLDLELRAIWNEDSDDRQILRERSTCFREAAEAADPLAVINPSGLEFALLSARMRLVWSKRHLRAAGRPEQLRGVTWESLPEAAKEELRAACRDLADYSRRLQGLGRRRKDMLSTHLEAVAETYIRFSRPSIAPWELSREKKSRFIQFTQLALEPFFAVSEYGPDGLSSRWRVYLEKHDEAADFTIPDNDEDEAAAS